MCIRDRSTGVLWPRRREKNDELRNKEERFLGTEIYGKQPLPTRHDSHLPESSKGGMHCEIGDLYNEEETTEYLEEDRTNKSKLGNLEEGYESNNEENEERIGNEKNEREVVLRKKTSLHIPRKRNREETILWTERFCFMPHCQGLGRLSRNFTVESCRF